MKLYYNGNTFVNGQFHIDIPMHKSANILASLSILTLIILSVWIILTPFTVALAQSVNTNNSTIKNAQSNSSSNLSTSNQHAPNGGNHIFLKPLTGTNNATNQPQMIANISSKGIYKVQIQWHTPYSNQSRVFPKSGFGLEIRFLNGTAQSATSKNIPNRHAETGVTTMGVGTQYRVPGSIQRLMPVSRYDVTIYDNHGNILWNKTNQYVSAGIGLEHVVLPKVYTGEIHILIHNIKSNSAMTGSNLTPLSIPLAKGRTDSVDFVAQVR